MRSDEACRLRAILSKSRGRCSAAGHAYAAEHDRHYGICHKVDGWFADLFMEIGPEADARRALPLIARDPLRLADCPNSGPEAPSDDAVRARFFGEEPA